MPSKETPLTGPKKGRLKGDMSPSLYLSHPASFIFFFGPQTLELHVCLVFARFTGLWHVAMAPGKGQAELRPMLDKPIHWPNQI